MFGFWQPIKDGNRHAYWLYQRHYSAVHYRTKHQRLFVGPGHKLVLMSSDGSALFAWRKFIDKSGQTGINCAIFRNESSQQSSQLILEAEGYAWQRWPGERLYTYVNPRKIKSSNPGFCFLMAGWTKCGTTSKGLIILEKLPGTIKCLNNSPSKPC
jgi:hypothetical protein